MLNGYSSHGGRLTSPVLQSAKSAGFTAVTMCSYPLDTTAGSFTIFLPEFPVRGSVVEFWDYGSSFSDHAITINRNGKLIMGLEEDYLLNQKNRGRRFTYVSGLKGWLISSLVSDTETFLEKIVAAGLTETALSDLILLAATISNANIADSVITNPTITGGNLINTAIANGVLNSPTINNAAIEDSTLNTTIINDATINTPIINSAVIDNSDINQPTITGPTIDGGSIVGANVSNSNIYGAVIKGYTEETTVANSATAYTFNITNSTIFVITLTGNVVYTFPAAAIGKSFVLYQKQDATGGRTATWPANVKWPGGIVPTLTAVALKANRFEFVCFDGVNWTGRSDGGAY